MSIADTRGSRADNDDPVCQLLCLVRSLYMLLALSKPVSLIFSRPTTSAADSVERISPLGSLADRKCETNIIAPGILKSLSISGE